MVSAMKSPYFFATLTAIFMGHNMVLIKSLLFTIDPLILAFLRMFFVAITLAIICYIGFGLVRPNKQQWISLLVISFLGVFLHQITLALGLAYSQTTNSALIMGLNPLTSTLLGALMLKEVLFRRHYIGILLGFIGICFIVFRGFSSFSFSIGDILIFISMATQALSFVYIRRLANSMHVIPITAYMYILGSIMLLVVPVTRDMGVVLTFAGFTWIKIMLSSVVLTAFAFILWNNCIQQLGVGASSIFLNLNTVTALFGAVVYLGEELLLQHIFGFLFISAGIWVATHHKKGKRASTMIEQSI